MISMHSNRVMKMLAALLVVCLLVSCVLAPPAHAAISEAVVITLGAAGVIAAILTAMGIKQQGNDSTYFSNLVSQCGVYLKGIGYVTADGKMQVNAFDAGKTMVAATVIDAVRDYLFDNGFVNSVPSCSVSLNGSFFLGSDDFSWTSTAGGFFVLSYTFNSGNSFPYDYCLHFLTKTYETKVYLNGSGSGCWERASSFLDGSYYQAIVKTGSWSVLPSSDIPFYRTEQYGSLSGFSLPSGGISSDVLDVTGAGTLDPQSNIDVIYPGWADRSVSVDTNIQQDLDNDGAIDNIITAGKYYPLTVPLDATDVITDVKDWSQEYAQTGTPAKAAEATHADTKDTTGTKEAADSFSLGGSGDYTFQVRDFFPFCVPFDLYDMLNCLAADPVAPRFDWVIPVLGNNYKVSVNLDKFDYVARILRTMELLAFAVGLAVATKKLIQGGD